MYFSLSISFIQANLNQSVWVHWCNMPHNSVFCARRSNARHESLDLMSTISGKWNLFICIKIPLLLWSINAKCLLDFFHLQLFLKIGVMHMKNRKKIWSEDQAEDEIQASFFRGKHLGLCWALSSSWASSQPGGAGSQPLFQWVISLCQRRDN